MNEKRLAVVPDTPTPAEPENAGELVGWLVDAVHEIGGVLPPPLPARYGVAIKKMLAGGTTAEQVRDGLRLMAEKGRLHQPSLLPSFVAEASLPKAKPRIDPAATRFGRGLTTEQAMDRIIRGVPSE